MCWLPGQQKVADAGATAAPGATAGAGADARAGWELPPWVTDGYEKEEMAQGCEAVQGHPFLLAGRPPAVGQRLYMQLSYEHDGSHPQTYRGWARMVGEVTEVLPPPPPGVYGAYAGQQVALSPAELEGERVRLPALPPSFVQTCQCGRVHDAPSVLRDFGALHGQRVCCRIRLSCDDEHQLVPQLGGEWDAELICNDTKINVWELCKMAPAPGFHQCRTPAARRGAAAAPRGT